jgi:hypothetical protein
MRPVRDRITQMDSLIQFMHELGHNFGSGHTHDVWSSSYPWGYSPQIDTCGNTCPSELPLARSATIMSYCHQCSGDYSNMAYTFGGKYKGTGLRSDINSYENSPLAGTVSTEPRQVNAMMWSHVSSRGTCSEPYPMGVSIFVEYGVFFLPVYCTKNSLKHSHSFTFEATDYLCSNTHVRSHVRSNTLRGWWMEC